MTQKKYTKKESGPLKACSLPYSYLIISEIVFVNFEEALGMLTYGAHFGSLGSDYDMSAITAFPNGNT